MKFTIVCLLLLMILPGTQASAADQNSSGFLNEPIQITAVESDTEALYYWRDHVTKKRPLILISGNFFLLPVPADMLEKGKELAQKGSLDEIRHRAVFPTSDPTLFPGMGLSTAIELDWFSEILWIVPVKQDDPFPTLEQFKTSLIGTSLEKSINVDDLQQKGECFSGSLGKTPLRVCSTKGLTEVTDPAIIHIDLSFFKAIYVNPVKTPVNETVLKQMRLFKKNNWPVMAATLSASMVQGDIALDVRFLLESIAIMVSAPETLESSRPAWQQFDTAQYLQSLFRTDMAHEILLKLSQANPGDPHLLFALYSSYSNIKKGDEALVTLAKAVKLDRVYGYEYLNLHERAKDKRASGAALQMLEQAETLFPEDPWIKLQIAEFMANTTHNEMTLEYIRRLQAMTWSATYYPQMPSNLGQFAQDMQPDSSLTEEKKL